MGPEADIEAETAHAAPHNFNTNLTWSVMSAEKEVIRHEAILHRNRIDPFSEDIEAVCEHFFTALNPQPGQVISIYWPKGREFTPAAIIEELLNKGFTCALPVVEKEQRVLKFARFDQSSTLEEGPYKIMQPEVNENTVWLEPDILIVPLLAFDRRGYRLGYGGGHYDATITDLRSRKNVTVVGLGYGQQAVIFNLPIEPHDEKLDWIITPLEARSFARD
jgi:5-formyltetrahydrofolate cyclo-ligase